MITEKLGKFLQRQKTNMLKLDEENYDANSPRYYDEKNHKMVSGMSILYENTIKWLSSNEAYSALWEDFQKAEMSINEDTLSTDAPTFTTFMLPMVRRLYHNLVAQELISIQPIPNPSAYVYYLNKVYSDDYATDSITGGTTRLDQAQAKSYVERGEQETIRAIQMNLERLKIEAITDKLAAEWTLEAEQDWNSQYKLSVEGELVSEIIDEIRRELDRRIFDALIAGIAYTINWDPTAYRTGDVNVSLYRKAYEETIYDAIIDAQTWIMNNCRGVVADQNFQWNLVMSATTWARFAKLENYNLTRLDVRTETGIGRRFVGIINSLFKCYIAPEMSDDQILVTGKSGWTLSPGYYAPYLPLYTSPKYIINNDFTRFARGCMARHAFGIIPTDYDSSTSNLLCLVNFAVS